jgi:hypothetical protein
MTRFRTDTLMKTAPPIVFADLGLGVMDGAVVEAAAYVLERHDAPNDPDIVCIRVLEALPPDKQGILLHAVQAGPNSGVRTLFRPKLRSLAEIPNFPFAYWAAEDLLGTFRRLSGLGQAGCRTEIGASTKDDFRFLRAWWEVAPIHPWKPYVKGGPKSPYYADVHLLVLWGNSPREIDALLCSRYPYLKGNSGWVLHPESSYGQAGATWTSRTKSALSVRALPVGCIFSIKGPGFFVDADQTALLAYLAILNSGAFQVLLDLQLAAAEPTGRGGVARSYEIGLLANTPVPPLMAEDVAELSLSARRLWLLQYTRAKTDETSHAFVLPRLLTERIGGQSEAEIERNVGECQRKVDEVAFRLYGLGSDGSSPPAQFNNSAGDESQGDTQSDDDDSDEPESGVVSSSTETLSWLVGVGFGRFDPRLATGERPGPSGPGPFDPLPSRSPGMYPEGHDLADRRDILVDDESHPDDLAAGAQAVAERVQVEVPEDFRSWLAKEFFPLHIKMYSKSRRKAPIYWQLATPSASYSVWLYIHSFNTDTLFRVQNDFVAPKLAHEDRRLESLTMELRDRATAVQRKELAAQEALVEELRAFLEEVKRVAPLWNPNLDDGVVINFAPLWRLVPQDKPWQKELKSTWDALCEGKYDWAHLGMHLWPERVVAKCAKDRSLAIAHGLEDAFWVEGSDGRWTAREAPTRSVDELVRERTSPAVKSALKSLLEAPVVTGKSVGRRGRGKAAATAERGDA